ncbi:sensor histidine kinase [Tessaracoccus caeni]|uniref:sensor histidine kinase n=1 Tax=Tessaracoccus caeni TaxID=3031239 RepID=UPI0023DAC297|nr:histidine kinase [Tessaracoccus caeni]MDF1488314.1 histidine kinase [Tessaracoccus caeni]
MKGRSPWMVGTAVVAGLGLIAAAWGIALPWPADNPTGFVLGTSVLALMAAVGAGILLVAGWSRMESLPVRVAMLVLGSTALAYPTLMAAAATERGSQIVAILAITGHVLPLTMVSLLPILASAAVTGRSRRLWVLALLSLVLVSTIINAAGIPGLAPIGSLTWLGSFALPMTATWPLVRGTAGEARRRAIVCGLASVLPVVIIAFCWALGAAHAVLGLGGSEVTALMLGFSACTMSTAVLTWGACTPRSTWVLRTPTILGLLAATLAAATLIIALGVGLGVTAVGGPAPLALLAGVLATALLGFAAVRLHSWAARLIDPPPEFTVELAVRTAEAIAAERQRLTRDLHDGLQGRLLGITLNLQLSGATLDDPSARLLIEDTVEALRDAVDEVRSLSDGRVPSILSEGGLAPALSHLVRPLSSVTDLRLTSRRYAPEVEATAYFVASEALANAMKHARADRIGIAVEDRGATVHITVTDDGVGGADPLLGSGLRGIAERVSASGGLLVVREAAPHGTVVEATLPCGS